MTDKPAPVVREWTTLSPPGKWGAAIAEHNAAIRALLAEVEALKINLAKEAARSEGRLQLLHMAEPYIAIALIAAGYRPAQHAAAEGELPGLKNEYLIVEKARAAFAQELVAWCEKRRAGWRIATEDLESIIAEIRRRAGSWL